MEITKSYWHSDGDRINLSVPFFKVDEERRIVSGFATLDNVDRQKDVVDAEASMKAFDQFRGNLREMHQPIAVGKVTNFREEQFYDKTTGETYRGVFVDTYVSKGAQDTWEKVLDGTLSGFSIGGNITKVDTVQKGDDMVRVIKEYELVELSLVDSPANQLANIFAVQKSDTGNSVTGIAVDLKMDNIFWCEADQIAVSKEADSSECLVCNSEMINIGWVESNDVAKNEEIGKAVDRYINKNVFSGSQEGTELLPDLTQMAKQAEKTIHKGGAVSMENEINEEVSTEEVAEKSDVVEETVSEEVVEKSDEVVSEEEAEESSEEVEEEVEKAADISEVEVEEPDFAKMLDDLKTYFGENISKSAEETKTTVDELSKSIDARITELAEKHDQISKSVETIKSSIDSIEKRVDLVESETAVKKSSDLDGSKEEKTIRKGIWSGSFLGVRDL